MSDLTLEEKTKNASDQAQEEIAEKHFFDKNQPHFPCGFSVNYREPGHWDIYADQAKGRVDAFESLKEGDFTPAANGQRERAFCIRGEAPNVFVRDERWDPYRPFPRESVPTFRSVLGAMLWIVEELMQEPELK